MTNPIDLNLLDAVCGGQIVETYERNPTHGQTAAYAQCNQKVDNKSFINPLRWTRQTHSSCLDSYRKAIEKNPPALVKREFKF
jgi:hypothetical protein